MFGRAAQNNQQLSKERAMLVHTTIVSVAFLTSCFIIYAIYHLVLLVGLKFGFSPANLGGGSPTEPFMFVFLFFVMVSLFPFFAFIGWMTLFKPKYQVPKYLPLVTIIIPAFNEQETVEKSIEHALNQDYPKFEVVVVDDGSSDFTPFLIDHPEVKALHLSQNKGKAHAVNQAIEEAKGDYVLFSDSDSHLHPNAIRHLVGHFNDSNVGAVSGQLIVRETPQLVVLWQTIEYIFSQAIVKVAQCGSGSSISVCPGPICIYKRSILLSLGGFKNRTLVEDFDMTLEVIASGNKTIYEPRAVAWTSTPKSFKALKSQRVRWYRGNLQAIKIHKNILFNRKHGMLGLFWFPYLLFWGFGGALIQIAFLLSLPVMMILSEDPLEVTLFSILLYTMFEFISVVQYIFTLTLDRNFKLSLIGAALIMKPYHLFLACMHLIALSRELTKAKVTWS